MLRLLPRGGGAIDCGGHKGAYSYWMARRVGRDGRVVAIEPQEAMARLMEKSFAEAGKRVRVIHAAASEGSGIATLKMRPSSTHGATLATFEPGTEFITTTVRAVTIDEVVREESLERVDFIKIDVEGHELEVVKGGLGTIDRLGPALLIEAEARKHDGSDAQIRALRELLEGRGYQGRFHDGRAWRPLGEMDVEKHQAYGKGRFCNNLLFVKSAAPGTTANIHPT